MLAGMMQQVPLTLNMVRERLAALYADKAVTTRFRDRIHVMTYREVLQRAGRLASAIDKCGVGRGARVATLAWNSHRHLELYLAVPCMGAVLHTINARFSPADIEQLLVHAEDELLFVDQSIWSIVRGEIHIPACVRRVVVMEDEDIDGTPTSPNSPDLACGRYEDFVDGHSSDFSWPSLDESEASGLCYTSGTTGDPKGVLYSHRSTTLHTLACLFADGIAMREREVCMPAVPMFHANAWGFPYAAMMAGAALALPCRQTDPSSLIELIATAGVTMGTAVPTVWSDFLDHIRSNPASIPLIASLKRLPVGGAAVSRSLIDGFASFGIEIMHCWGMTEISPLGLTNVERSDLSSGDQQAARTAQGLPIPGCITRIVDEDGCPLPWDGTASGELQVRSPWAAAGYFGGRAHPGPNRPEASFAGEEGHEWLRTGDIATIDANGYVRIVDRTKDLIKSGGEWISSQALEARLTDHPDVREAAAVGRPHPKWQERPVACIVLRHDTPESRRRFAMQFRTYMSQAFPKWQIPDEVRFWSHLPKGKTGKIDKTALRQKLTHIDQN